MTSTRSGFITLRVEEALAKAKRENEKPANRAHVGTATDTDRGWLVAQTGSRLVVCCFAEWYSAGGRIANPRHPDASGPVCATVAVPRCAQRHPDCKSAVDLENAGHYKGG